MPRPLWIDPVLFPGHVPTLHPDPLLNVLLAGRAPTPAAAADFLDPRPRPAPDPSLLPGLAAAAERVNRAIVSGERIAIYGDYDADGISATALLTRGLRAATGGAAPVVSQLPTRRDGYGLHPAAIAAIAAADVSLLIVVDCGSTDHANVALARASGVDVVVLDHHQMNGPPPSDAFVVSAQLLPGAPYRELTAAGVAYLLAVSLARLGHDLGDGTGSEPTSLLGLVALGTIGDVAPLTGVNRALVRDGLRVLAERPSAGILALCQRAGVALATLTAEQVAFKLAPRLNAAGRMADPQLALDLLLTDDRRRAALLAQELERLNVQRRLESQRVAAEAERLVLQQSDNADRPLLVVASSGWGSGVLGLAAGRLVERFGRPVLVLNDDGEMSRGSARSVPGFDIAQALVGCADLLHAHGGHSQAAGLTLPTPLLPRLEAALQSALLASSARVPAAPSLQIDADLPSERLTIATAELFAHLQPFGAGNSQPMLRVRQLPVRSYNVIGQDRSHLKLHLETPRGVVPALFWSAAPRSSELIRQPLVDLVVTIGLDYWNGQRRLHVEVKDFRPAA